MIYRRTGLVCTVLLSLFFCGCVNKDADLKKVGFSCDLSIGENYSSNQMLDKKVEANPGDSVFDILERNSDVQTTSAGFINSINGIKSKVKGNSGEDWFFYVNGISSNCSAKDYKVSSNDKIIWDYHGWDMNSFLPAVVGSFPEPFIKGFKGATKAPVIYYAGGIEKEAQNIKQTFVKNGAASVNVQKLPEKFQYISANPIFIIGEWKYLKSNKEVKTLFTDGLKKGIYVKVLDDKVELLDVKGSVKKTYPADSAVLISSAYTSTETCPIWILTSPKEEMIKEFANILCSNPEKVKNLYGACLYKGNIENLPIK